MAVNYLIFDGVKSSDYGIYISGEALFNAPKRDAEAVSIPGRNGSFLLDNNRYENIQVKYPAFCYSSTYAAFIANIDNFRNAIASKVGYKRLTDTFHPDEYRMGAFIEGLEVDPIMYNSGAKFEITFECKPQRWLTSGENAEAVANNGILSNTTLYDASPLLAVEGYGNISFNGYSVDIENEVLGDITIMAKTTKVATANVNKAFSLDTTLYNSGDTLTTHAPTFEIDFSRNNATAGTITSASISSETGYGSSRLWNASSKRSFTVTMSNEHFSMASNTTKSRSHSVSVAVVVTDYNSTTHSGTVTIATSVAYASDVITYTATVTIPAALTSYLNMGHIVYDVAAVTANSTVTILGHPTYIDCDLGEAYKIDNGSVIDLNSYIDLGSDLPVLSPGGNAFTYDNTITDLQVTPRWWKL